MSQGHHHRGKPSAQVYTRFAMQLQASACIPTLLLGSAAFADTEGGSARLCHGDRSEVERPSRLAAWTQQQASDWNQRVCRPKLWIALIRELRRNRFAPPQRHRKWPSAEVGGHPALSPRRSLRPESSPREPHDTSRRPHVSAACFSQMALVPSNSQSAARNLRLLGARTSEGIRSYPVLVADQFLMHSPCSDLTC